MKKFICLLFSILGILSCQVDEVAPGNLIQNIVISKSSLLANGTDQSEVIIILADNTVPELAKISVKLSRGTIQESGEAEHILTPEVQFNGEVQAIFHVIASNSPGEMNITISIDTFTFNRTIMLTESLPARISLAADAFNVQADFGNEITLSATVTNADGANISGGFHVLFRDFLQNNTAITGFYRPNDTLVVSGRSTSTIYSPGPINPNQFINIIGEVLDDHFRPLGITDTLEIFISPKE